MLILVHMPRPQGHPRKVALDAIVDDAFRVFWDQGYARTSISDLTSWSATGSRGCLLANSSLEVLPGAPDGGSAIAGHFQHLRVSGALGGTSSADWFIQTSDGPACRTCGRSIPGKGQDAMA